MLEQYGFMLCPTPIKLSKDKIYGLQGACAQPKTVLPAQLDLVQVQHHENLLDFGALIEIS